MGKTKWGIWCGDMKEEYNYNFKEQVFRDWMITQSIWYNFKEAIVNLCCAFVLYQTVYSRIVESTWQFLFDYGESKYKYFFRNKFYANQHTFNSCFVTSLRLNAKKSTVKP